MNREKAFQALAELDDRYIAEVVRYAPGDASGSPERTLYMKKKRLITMALAAALILSLGMVAYAIAGTPHSQGTYAMKDTGNYTSLEDLPKAEKIVGYNIHLIDRFSNGYTFSDMRVDGGAVFDENYNALKEYYSVIATYTLPEKEDITVSLYPVLDLEGSHEAPAPSSGCIIGNTEVRINRDHYKVVPEDYEKTEEDLAAEAAGHFYISYGSDEIEEYDFVSAEFVLDGVDYVLLCMKADRISDEMLVQMISELISSAGR